MASSLKMGNKKNNIIKPGALLFIIFFSAITSLESATVINPDVLGVTGTKHNLSMYGPGSVQATSTTEVCVFCHTPHFSQPNTPLWNKQDPGTTYTIYSAQTLTSNSVGQPTGSSRLCLSCHDGTIALGSLLNAPGAGLAQIMDMMGVEPGTGALVSTSAANLGADLSNEHPISFSYSSSYPANSEIKNPGTNNANIAPALLDYSGNIQCASCHDPHTRTYPKFLRTALNPATGDYGAQLCNFCHEKQYWNNTDAPVHREENTFTWTGVIGTDPNPWEPSDFGVANDYTDDNLKMHGCLSCHRSHGGVVGKHLLKGRDADDINKPMVGEEWTCLNCHNGKMKDTNATNSIFIKDINAVLSSTYAHDSKGTYNTHIPTRFPSGTPSVREDQLNLDSPNRHAECPDCHNPHGAKKGNHTVGGITGNRVGKNLIGAWGVQPMWAAAGVPANIYTTIQLSDPTSSLSYEAYLCIKCHSYYAYNISPPQLSGKFPNFPGVDTGYESDPTADFNVNNYAFHPVFESIGKNQPLSLTANPYWPANGLGLTNTFRCAYFGTCTTTTGPEVAHRSAITCSDCHGNSDYASTAPKGPHGSNNKYILRSNETGLGSSKNFCYNCHRRDVYGDEGYVGINANYARVSHPVDGNGTSSPFYQSGAIRGNNSNKFGILCLTCHGGGTKTQNGNTVIDGIHGSNTAAGTLPGSDPLGYRMMNGACVESYTRPPTTTTGGQLNFRAAGAAPNNDKVCSDDFLPVTISPGSVNYNCNTISDCSN